MELLIFGLALIVLNAILCVKDKRRIDEIHKRRMEDIYKIGLPSEDVKDIEMLYKREDMFRLEQKLYKMANQRNE